MSIYGKYGKLVRYIIFGIVLFGFIGLWELIIFVTKIPQYLFPSPSSIFTIFIKHIGSLSLDLMITGLESFVGFIIAIIFAGGISILFTYSKRLYNVFMPFLIGIKAVPLIAIAPLLVLWLGNGFLSKAVMASTICFFPIVVNLTRGFRDIPEDQVELMISLSANKSQIFKMIRLPNSLPYFFAALKITSTLSVVGAIVAEFAGANQGIGYVILVAALRIDTPLLFCGIILASLLGLVFYYVLEFIEERVVFWRSINE